MIVVRLSRANGKTYLLHQRIKKALENGETVLLVTTSGPVVVDKKWAVLLEEVEGKTCLMPKWEG